MSGHARSAKAAESEVIISYKGFDANLQCRGYQFEVGQTYVATGTIESCRNGFHACPHPLSVLSFYPLRDGNRYCLVEQSGKTDGVEKIAGETIKVSAEIGVPGLLKAAVEWTKKAAGKPATSGNYANSATSGDYAHSATSADEERDRRNAA